MERSPPGVDTIISPVRTARRVQAAGAAPCTVMTDRPRAAARRVREIAAKLPSRSKLGREEATQAIARVTSELADLAGKTAAQAGAVLCNGRRAVPKVLSGGMRGQAAPRAGRTRGHHRAHYHDHHAGGPISGYLGRDRARAQRPGEEPEGRHQVAPDE
jgi:hypothetical protein